VSQVTILELLPQTTYDGGGTGNIYTVTGNAQPAAAYYLGNQDLQTVNIKLTDCSANIVIEATLDSNSSNAQWFTVYELVANANAASGSEPYDSSDASIYTNIEGNFVYMRAKIVDFAGGVVNFVKLSY
jgi:hypothetical protein